MSFFRSKRNLHGGPARRRSWGRKPKPEEPLTNVTRVGKSSVDLVNTYDKIQEKELVNSDLLNYEFNYQDMTSGPSGAGTGQMLPSKLFMRSQSEGNNFVTKFINSTTRNAYDRIEVNPEALDKFKYTAVGTEGELVGTDAVEALLRDRGLSDKNIDRILDRTAKVAATDEVVEGADAVIKGTDSTKTNPFQKIKDFIDANNAKKPEFVSHGAGYPFNLKGSKTAGTTGGKTIKRGYPFFDEIEVGTTGLKTDPLTTKINAGNNVTATKIQSTLDKLDNSNSKKMVWRAGDPTGTQNLPAGPDLDPTPVPLSRSKYPEVPIGEARTYKRHGAYGFLKEAEEGTEGTLQYYDQPQYEGQNPAMWTDKVEGGKLYKWKEPKPIGLKTSSTSSEDLIDIGKNISDDATSKIDVLNSDSVISTIEDKATEEIGTKIIEEGGEEVAEEIGTKIASEVVEATGEEIVEDAALKTASKFGDIFGKGVAVAKGTHQAAKGIEEGRPEEVVHGAVNAATPWLISAAMASPEPLTKVGLLGVVAVNTIWDILDG